MLPETKRKMGLIRGEIFWFIVGFILSIILLIKGDSTHGVMMWIYCIAIGNSARITLLQDKVETLRNRLVFSNYERERLRNDCFSCFERKK